MQSRSFPDAAYKTELSGAPDGKYVVIRYRVSFENKAGAVETITPVLDKDGLWRISGYFVRLVTLSAAGVGSGSLAGVVARAR